MMTKRQAELLSYIVSYLNSERGVSPSFDEMKVALGFKSRSGVHRLVAAIEARGFIRRLPYRARAIEVIRIPWKSDVPLGAPAVPAPFPPRAAA